MHPIMSADTAQDVDSGTGGGVLVLVGPSFNFCRSLVRSLENEIEGLSVVYVEKLDMLLDRQVAWPIVRLMLIDSRLADEAARRSDEVRALIPYGIVAISYEEDSSLPAQFMQYLHMGLLTSAVPINLQFDRWLSAIRLMLAGEDYLPSHLLRMMAVGASDGAAEGVTQALLQDGGEPNPLSAKARIGELTPRQVDIMRLVAEGHQNKEIAVRLNLSEHTVKLHIHHIFSKLGAHNRTQAVKMLFG